MKMIPVRVPVAVAREPVAAAVRVEMQVSEVTPTSIDFVAGNGLDETAFRSCYLRKPSLDAVHRQMSLGQVMAVRATPTYFVNGWLIQVPNDTWFPEFLETLLRGEEP